MCIRFNRLILLIITFLSASIFVEARDLAPYKKTCKDIGFKEGTEKFGKCVVKLIKRDKARGKEEKAERNKTVETEDNYEFQKSIMNKHKRAIEQSKQQELLRERELELARERLELEKRRVEIEEQRANQDKWNNISKGLKSLSDTLYGNQNQRNDDYEKQLCINECRAQGDNYSYCQRVCR